MMDQRSKDFYRTCLLCALWILIILLLSVGLFMIIYGALTKCIIWVMIGVACLAVSSAVYSYRYKMFCFSEETMQHSVQYQMI